MMNRSIDFHTWERLNRVRERRRIRGLRGVEYKKDSVVITTWPDQIKTFQEQQLPPDTEEVAITCEVCFEEYLKKDFHALNCGHSYCLNCVRDHIKLSLTENSQAKQIPCMRGEQCKRTYSVDDLYALEVPQNVVLMFRQRIQNL